MKSIERMTPVELYEARRRRRIWLALAVILAVIAAAVFWHLIAEVPVDYESTTEHFKYGSIGSDGADGIPLQIWQILPELFPEHLPDKGARYLRAPESPRRYLDGYASFGFIIEKDHPLPIGFSQRRVLVDRVGLNCAVCHTSTVRVTGNMQPDRIYDRPPVYVERQSADGSGHAIRSVLIAGMPANTLDLEAYFVFLFKCAEDERFTTANIMNAIERHSPNLCIADRLILKRAIPQLRDTLLVRRQQLHYLSGLHREVSTEESMPPFGPGRVDTFSPYKSIQFGFPYDGKFGIADYPSIWNQRPREGMQLHWDGNNTSVFERNLSASLGAGTTPVSIDMPRLVRITRWIGAAPPPNPRYGGTTDPPDPTVLVAERNNPFPHRGELPIPKYPFPVNSQVAELGAKVFDTVCAKCHGWKGAGVGHVVDIAAIGTDPARLDSYTEALEANQNLLGTGQWWRFSHFRKTTGYANSPLDGVWLRAPYLHNGSVPSLTDLLNRPCEIDDLKALKLITQQDWDNLETHPERVAQIIAESRKLHLRPPVFFRGDDEYDPDVLGFRCDRATSEDGRRLFLYRTFDVVEGTPRRKLGNGHQGHYGFDYGGLLPDDARIALLEYLKTIAVPQSD